MKIAYLSFETPDQKSGVGKKIKAQISQWRNSGNDVKHFLLMSTEATVSETVFSPARLHNQPTLNIFLNRRGLHEALKAFSPDIIYTRELLYFPGLIEILKTAYYIIEINSDAKAEYRHASLLKYIYYKMFNRKIFNNSSGAVFVSNELIRKTAWLGEKPTLTLANGYDFDSIPIMHNKCNKDINFIFVGSPNQEWHGLDQLEALARHLPEYKFHVVVEGYTSSIANIISHGALYGEALIQLYRLADIGVGTLALHRKNMKEASPLKTREYIAYGLPVIIPYYDTDLDNLGIEQGVLRIENKTGAAVDAVQDIKSFVEKWSGRRIDRDIFVPLLSYKTKEEKRLKFMQDIIDAKN